MVNLPEELRDYTIKRSKRAKHVGLKLSMRDGLIVTVPERFNEKKLPAILVEREDWIEKHWQKFKKRSHFEEVRAAADQPLPKTIELLAINQDYQLCYERFKANKENADLIYVYPNLSVAETHTHLQKWLHRKAKEVLVPWLHEVSQEVGLPFHGVTIRNQKTRWGSCSSKKNINLNQKLLFLPPEYVEYIMVHELCHTVHMNHSRKFWQLVEELMPEARDFDRRMRDEGWRDYVPVWCD